MVSKAAESRILRHLGTVVVVMNVVVAVFSLSDMYLLASGAVQVKLPSEKDFTWRFDPDKAAIIFTGNYSVRNNGFYDISDLHIDASVKDVGGALLVSYRKGDMKIPAFGGGNYAIKAILPVERLFQLNYGSMLFDPACFMVHVKITALYVLGMARFSSEETLRYNWTPPLKDFAELFLDGNFSSLVKSSIPGVPELAKYLESYVASAIMAKGVPVVLKMADLDLVFRYDVNKLFVSLTPHDTPWISMLDMDFDIPSGGDGSGGA